MKLRFSMLFILAMMAVTLFSGCGSKNQDKTGVQTQAELNQEDSRIEEKETDQKLNIVCTIFPEYDWVRQIIGDQIGDVNLTLLLDNGVDLHSYQPTAEDMVKISQADVFLYVGGESDQWVVDVLDTADNKNMVVIDLLSTLGEQIKEEEIVEGMQADEHEEEEDETDHADDDHAEEVEYDEHVWLSLKNAVTICNAIKDGLSLADPDNSDVYAANCENYVSSLNELDQKYEAVVENAKRTTVLFGDRFPFRYMAEDYGLTYYAAFVGCSAETEASFETITFLAGKVDELALPAVCVIENSDQKIAQTIINNTQNKDQKIKVMDSMQSVTSNDIADGENYLSIMEENLAVLEEALN